MIRSGGRFGCFGFGAPRESGDDKNRGVLHNLTDSHTRHHDRVTPVTVAR